MIKRGDVQEMTLRLGLNVLCTIGSIYEVEISAVPNSRLSGLVSASPAAPPNMHSKIACLLLIIALTAHHALSRPVEVQQETLQAADEAGDGASAFWRPRPGAPLWQAANVSEACRGAPAWPPMPCVLAA